jgi:hypothetical protein
MFLNSQRPMPMPPSPAPSPPQSGGEGYSEVLYPHKIRKSPLFFMLPTSNRHAPAHTARGAMSPNRSAGVSKAIRNVRFRRPPYYRWRLLKREDDRTI